MAELLTIREGQTFIRLAMRFPAESLEGFNEAEMVIKLPSGDAITRAASLEFDSATVTYDWQEADPEIEIGIYTFITQLKDAEGRIARSRHAGRFRVIEEFAT